MSDEVPEPRAGDAGDPGATGDAGAAAPPAAPPEPAAEPEVAAAPPPEPTGDPRVDAALARLGDLPGRPVPEHVEIFEDVHQRLQELLAAADQDDDSAQPRQPPQPQRPAFPSALRPRPGEPVAPGNAGSRG
ncbi:hypothetical protein [Actinomadura litoris]|uniref:hypothetical protein n=1 Tax=Actinomadura litoris TaxID=2678616 RepID=UPI001C12B20C|nr:hypothetical protein [Actinomadura litoris]